MAVPNQIPYNIFTANGITTVFSFNFMVFNATDLAVSVNGTVLTSGFTVSGVGVVNGGSVTFLTPPASGATVMLARGMPLVRVTEYQDNGDLLAATVNKDFDRIWMVLQGQAVDNSLALSRPSIAYDYYAGRGYRIADIASPINSEDVANKKYVDDSANVILESLDSKTARSLRVPEDSIAVIPSAEDRANMLLAFDSEGGPIVVLPADGSAADVLLKLAANNGWALIGTPTGTVQLAIETLTSSKMAKASNLSDVDNPAISRKNIGLEHAVLTTDSSTALDGYLSAKGLTVRPPNGSSEGAQIDLHDKNNVRAGYIDIDSAGNLRIVTEELGVALSISRANRDISTGATLTAAGSVRAGNGVAWIAADGNIYGPVWGGYLNSYIANRLATPVVPTATGIGAYVYGSYSLYSTDALYIGAVVAGANIVTASATRVGLSGLSVGSWRLQGHIHAGAGDNRISLWVRIS